MSVDTIKKYLSGCLSGIVSTLIFHPVDILRIRLFYEGTSLGKLNTFYNGIGFNLLTGCVKNMFVFPTQEHFKDIFVKKGYGEYKAEFYSSIVSGSLLSLISTPINVVKIPLQSNTINYSPLHIIKDIHKKYGIAGFYRGGGGTFLRDVSWNGVYFPLYKNLNENYIDNKILSSILAGSIAMTVSYPFDGIRLYRQNNNKDYNFWFGFMRSFNLSKGNLQSYGTSILRIPTATTVSHMCYLYLSQYLLSK